MIHTRDVLFPRVKDSEAHRDWLRRNPMRLGGARSETLGYRCCTRYIANSISSETERQAHAEAGVISLQRLQDSRIACRGGSKSWCP